MPLPHITRFCRSTCRATGQPCRNPAAYGMPVCAKHGAHPRDTVKRGADHGGYKSGEYTQTAKAEGRAAAARLRDLETMAFNMGLMRGKRTPGRKPKASATPPAARLSPDREFAKV